MHSGLTDEALAALTQQGEMAAFDEIARRYQTTLLRFVRRHCANLSDAEDVVQDALVKAFQNIRQYRVTWPFKTWLFTLTFRTAVSHARRRWTALRLIKAWRPDDKSQAPTETVAGHDEVRNIWDAAGRVLSPIQFRALWLLYAEEMEREQIATIIGKSPSATKLIIYRARQRMQWHFLIRRHQLTQPAPEAAGLCRE